MLYLGIIKNRYNMRLENEAPQTTIERTIENILTNNGIKQNDIQFRGTERYLRIGYWQHLNEDIRAQLSGLVTAEIDMYDDDCGYLFSYEIKH
jgi:hypothetical protein